MRKILALASISMGMFVCTLNATDHLKNSLTKMIHEKDTTPAMVDLSRLDMPQSAPVKSRSPRAVIATVNGHKIRKKEADAYLKKVTRGKVSDFDLLPKEQRIRLVKDLALPILMASAAKKELSEKEKEGMFVSMWMRKQAARVSVSDEEVKALYEELKQKSQAAGKQNNKIIPPFESIKNKMKSQMIEKKIMDGLMKDVKIEVAAPAALPPMMLRQPMNSTK